LGIVDVLGAGATSPVKRNSVNQYMQYQDLDRAGMAYSVGISGRLTADERSLGLWVSKERIFRRLFYFAFLGAAIAGFQVQQLKADDDENGARFIPSLIISSAVPANGDGNPYGMAFVPRGFPHQEGCSNLVIS
jgi:hypothetical protein